MPDKQEKLSNEPMVDLDTSGPGARVELPETEKEADKTYENEVKKDEPNIIYNAHESWVLTSTLCTDNTKSNNRPIQPSILDYV